MEDRDVRRLGQFDLQLHAAVEELRIHAVQNRSTRRRERGRQRSERSRIVEVHVAADVVFDVRTIGCADARLRGHLPQHAGVPTPAGVVTLYARTRFERRGRADQRRRRRRRNQSPCHRALHALRERRREVHPIRQLGVEPLKAHAGADGQRFRRLPRDHRIHVVRFDFRFDRLKASEPIGVVFGLESIRHIDADAERPFVGERHAEIQIGNDGAASGVATRPAEWLSECGLRSAVTEFRRRADQVSCDDELHRLQTHESGGIVENRAHILRRRCAAGVSVSEPARVLFLQRESRAVRVRSGQREQCGDNGHRDRRAAK